MRERERERKRKWDIKTYVVPLKWKQTVGIKQKW